MLPTIRALLHIRLSRFLPAQIPPFSSSTTFRAFSSISNPTETKDDSWDNKPSNTSNSDPLSNFQWDEASSWSTGLTKDHFDGEAVGHQLQIHKSTAIEQAARMDEVDDILRMVEKDNRKDKAFVDGWKDRMVETCQLLKQVREPGARGSYLKDSEKAEMYKLHKENPEVYNVERLAKDFRIMRQRVHAILWLKEMEEEEEEKLGRPLDDSVEILLDNFPE